MSASGRLPVSAGAGNVAQADALMREAFPLHQQGDVGAAERLYRQILALAPDYADAHYLLGVIARQQGDLDAAMQHVRQALRVRNDEAAFHQTLAECYHARQMWPEAIASYESALRLHPDSAQTWNELGFCQGEAGQLEEGARSFERALALAPDHGPALNNLGNARRDLGQVEEAVELLRRARDAFPDQPDVASNYLFTLNLSTRHSRDEVFRAHLEYDARFGSGRHGVPACPGADPDPERKLRIGYFSPDLRSHPVNAFISPVLARHDREHFEASCYYLYPWEDETSARLKSLADRWVHCAGDDDATLAERIRQDRIDILVDLAGHTGWNRLGALALKPAPVIATWLGYLNTTGLRAVDYRITDAFSDPPGAEAYHTEKLVRLPEGHSCFEQFDLAIDVNPLPALARGAVRFGSFNKASKLTDVVLAQWARVLRATPGSTLLIVGVGGPMAQHVVSTLAGHGVAADRVECRGRMALPEMLRAHHEVDLALDTHPYAGTTTTFNSLWMGVPSVTLAGAAPVSRSCGSVLTVLGLADFVAATPDEYVDIAARRAADIAGLARLRGELRQRLRQSPLMDAARFTRTLEEAYRQMWEAWCARRAG